jgi:Tol biopolymer transport system component
MIKKGAWQKMKYSALIIAAILILISFSGCVDPSDEPVLPERGFYMGLLPNPADGQDFSESYGLAAEYSELVPIWSSGAGANGFWDYAETLEGWWGTTFLEEYIRLNGMYPVIHFSFIDKDQSGDFILKTPETMPDATLNDPEWRALYKLSVIDVITTVKPAFVSLGNEVNRWYETYGAEQENENGFQHYVSLYEEIYDEVKQISPETTVFCVFSREIVSELTEADLNVLSYFDESTMDMLVFTTYPIAVQGINQVEDIPIDYYQKAAAYMPNTPFGFSEIGWPSYEQAGGQQGQCDFLTDLATTLTIDQGINLELFMYCWLHDQTTEDTTGLIDRAGKQRFGYEAWKQISTDTVRWHQQENNQIVFMSRADEEQGELYLLDKNDTITRLTNNKRHENNPALSFDGKKITYHAGNENDPLNWEIYMLDLETLEETKLTDNQVLDGHPDWSPDNNHIVYASFQDNQGKPAAVADLFVIDLDGNKIQQLTDNEWEDNDPEWSPDGTKIVFKSNRNTKTDAREEIYVMNSDGSNVTRLSSTTRWESDHDPSWSPDSKSIAFMHYAGIRPWTDLVNLNTFINHWDELTPWNTYIVDMNGTIQQVTDTDYIAQLAVFSKNGDQILYLDNDFILLNNKLRGIHHYFTLIDRDGSHKQRILPVDEHTPTVEYFDW